jgi:hypothetical protein
MPYLSPHITRISATVLRLAVILSVSSFPLLDYANPSSLNVFEPLTDGEYIISKIDYFPPQAFESHAAAQKYLKQASEKPPTPNPITTYYKLDINNGDFAIQQVKPTADGRYISATELMVGITATESWAFEEFASRVTIIHQRLTADNALKDGGAIRGILQNGFALYTELRSLGLSIVQWDPVTGNSVSGHLKLGEVLKGSIERDQEQRIRAIECEIRSSNGTVHRAQFQIHYTPTGADIAKTETLSILPSGKAVPLYAYTVISRTKLPAAIKLDKLWLASKSTSMQIFEYDPLRNVTQFLGPDGKYTPVIPLNEVVKENVQRERGRSAIIGIMITITILFAGGYILLRLNNSGKQQHT